MAFREEPPSGGSSSRLAFLFAIRYPTKSENGGQPMPLRPLAETVAPARGVLLTGAGLTSYRAGCASR